MRLTGRGIWGEPPDREEAVRVLRRAVELGVNFIDTADSYGPQVAENLIAEALYPYPKDFVIATKAGFERPAPDRWTPNGRPELPAPSARGEPPAPQAGAHRSLAAPSRRSGVPATNSSPPFASSSGRAWYVCSDSRRSRWPDRAGPTDRRDRSVQNRYNLTDREWEDEVEYCEREGMAFIPWFPLSAGDSTRAVPLARVAARHGATVFRSRSRGCSPIALHVGHSGYFLRRTPRGEYRGGGDQAVR